MEFNYKLFKAMREKGVTQRELGEAVGDHHSYVSRILNGWMNADDDRKLRYARFLGCDAKDLFD